MDSGRAKVPRVPGRAKVPWVDLNLAERIVAMIADVALNTSYPLCGTDSQIGRVGCIGPKRAFRLHGLGSLRRCLM